MTVRVSTYFVYAGDDFVASIVLQPRLADNYKHETPWLLLHNTGKIDRFPTYGEAVNHARKLWPTARFTTT